MARTVRDVATLLSVMASAEAPPPGAARPREALYRTAFSRPVRGMRIGWPSSYFFDRVEPQILAALKKAAAVFEDLGAHIEEVTMPDLDAALEAAQTIALAEASHFHTTSGWFPERALEYGEDVRAHLALGLGVTAVTYLAAFDLRRKINTEFQLIFRRVSALITPTAPVAAPLLGAERVRAGRSIAPLRAALIHQTRPANFTGVPAISLPCGFTRDRLPIGMQLIAPMWSEPRLLRFAFAYEQATDWHRQHPPHL
jgi:aspartyl-tRNA(Asn)/glutamyl-tRNA(Gln) amidotransferase subunit A